LPLEKTVEVNLFSDFWSVIKDKVFNSDLKKQSHGQRIYFTDEYDFETVKIELIKTTAALTQGINLSK
jgi:hypothetical protein